MGATGMMGRNPPIRFLGAEGEVCRVIGAVFSVFIVREIFCYIVAKG